MKTITSSFYTTTNIHSFRDVWKYIFTLKKKNYIQLTENKILKYLNLKKDTEIISFYNGRSALFHGLNLLNIKTGDEVIIQAYTCVSVPNSIIHTGAKPVYADVDQTLNMNPDLLEKIITKNTKAIMVQHNFWNPADLEKIQKICKKHNIFLIEDCAHSFWSEYDWKKVWTFWDISFFSFWRDKVISTVNGGFLVINNSKLTNKISGIKNKIKTPSKKLIIQNMFYLIISYLSYKTYDFFQLGKVLIFLSRKLKLIPEILSKQEKQCHDKTFFYSYPNALAYVALWEIDRVDSYNKKRTQIAKKYYSIFETKKEYSYVQTKEKSKNINLRFPLFVENPSKIMKEFKTKKILLGNRYQQVIAPENVNYSNAMYTKWSCPNAEKLASQTINLPCHPNLTNKDLEKVIRHITSSSRA